MRILNLTQHEATPAQIAAGVFEPQNKGAVETALTFNALPDRQGIVNAVRALVQIARDERADRVMIGGVPFLMAPLQEGLFLAGIQVLFAFSVRESKEAIDPVTGAVTKVSEFVHLGHVEAVDLSMVDLFDHTGRPCTCGSGADWRNCTEQEGWCG